MIYCTKPMFKKNKLYLLILVHLLLLWYPQMVKLLHVHQHEQVCCHFTHGVSFDLPENSCPICDFEFVSFIENLPTQLNVSLPEIKLVVIPVRESIYTNHLFYFSLRAPPIS